MIFRLRILCAFLRIFSSFAARFFVLNQYKVESIKSKVARKKCPSDGSALRQAQDGAQGCECSTAWVSPPRRGRHKAIFQRTSPVFAGIV
jgi:hypothetical protein